MKKLEHSISHSLDPKEARQLIEHALAHYRERYPAYQPLLTWHDKERGELRVNVRNQELVAEFELHTGCITIRMDVPLLLRPFQGAARRVIEREVARWLSPRSPAS